jgi:subtilisin family serine protease
MRVKAIFTLGLMASTMVFGQSVKRLDPYDMKYEPGVVLVKFGEEVDVPVGPAGKLGKMALAGVRQVMGKYGIQEAERLFPRAKRGEKLGKVKSFSGQEKDAESMYNIFSMKFDFKHDAKAVAEDLGKQEGVVYAEPDYFFYALEGAEGTLPSGGSSSPATIAGTSNTVPNDPLYAEQWYLKAFPGVNAEVAWDVTTGDTTQTIAIIDTGVDWDHPDLDGNIWRNWDEIPGNGIDDDGNGFVDDIRGWDFVNNDNDPNDDNSHGTHVAGIAAAEGNNGVGICGVAWKAKIMPVKMLQSSGSGSSSNLALAITYAALNGATVINMSLGSYGESITVKTALENAYSTSFLVAAAGNDGYKVDKPYPPWPPYAPLYPGCYGFVIGVEATEQTGNRVAFSNFDPTGPILTNDGYYWNEYGHNYEIKAPGVGIYSSVPNGAYSSYNGTSMSTPQVAGALTLIKSNQPSLSHEQLFARLIQGAQNGVLNIDNSIQLDLQPDLYYEGFAISDTLSGCDRDGRADAGETVKISLTIKNAGAQADSVWAKLRFGKYEDQTVANITDSTSSIGSISTYGTLTGSADPFIVQVNADNAHHRDIVFEYEIGAGDSSYRKGNLIVTVEKMMEIAGVYPGILHLTPNQFYVVTAHTIVDSLVVDPGTTIRLRNNVTMLIGQFANIHGKPDSLIVFTNDEGYGYWGQLKAAKSAKAHLSYCRLQYSQGAPVVRGFERIEDCIFEYCYGGSIFTPSYETYLCIEYYTDLFNNVIKDNIFGSIGISSNFACASSYNWRSADSLKFEQNIVTDNSTIYNSVYDAAVCVDGLYLGCFKNNITFGNGPFDWMITGSDSLYYHMSSNYFGTINQDTIDSQIKDFYDVPTLPAVLPNHFPGSPPSNCLTIPPSEAHGIVWKVLINGKNPQETKIDPIGMETVRFDVCFNRAMDTQCTPFLTFGVREPYTQHVVKDNAAWNADSTQWTAYFVFGLETGDGFNTIRVEGAKDDVHFEIPIERKRFQFIVDAAGSAANEFIADVGVGKVKLQWPKAPTEDVLGYNMYRFYNLTNSIFSDTIRSNNILITDTTYTDFAVIPDTTYHYMYKVLGTDMVESDFSKAVAATPVKASSGDANGDMAVNVQDIVFIVAYILEQTPQPFLFEAADMNHDGVINVLDVVAAVNKILSLPKALLANTEGGKAILSLYRDKIKLESGGEVGGLQFTLSGKEAEKLVFKPASAMEGFEIAKAEKDGKMIVVIYSLKRKTLPSGEQTLFTFEGAEGQSLMGVAACTGRGECVPVSVQNRGKVEIPKEFELFQSYPNPFNPETSIRYGLPKAAEVKLVIYNALGQKVRTLESGPREAGYHEVIWDSRDESGVKLPSGVYVYKIEAGEFEKSAKMVLVR